MEKLEVADHSISSVPPENHSITAAALYEAAITGSVATLDTLLEQSGMVILYRVSLTSFAETPLHLAALMGHLEFSKRLLKLRPELSSEQDSEKCTPLHLAAANGHIQVVKELLKANGKACLIQDQEGRVPLHLAALRGRVAVARELINSMHGQESVKKKVGDGDSVLHLCVKYNHLDVLEVVLASTSNDEELLKMTDSCGNTVLHLSVMLKQIETVRFLLELRRVRAEVINMLNGMNLTVLDVLNQSPRDFKSLEIREILASAGARGETVSQDSQPHPALDSEKKSGVGGTRTWKARVWHLLTQIMNYRGDWMNDTRGSLMMVASIIATVTFQAAIAPPGGAWQTDYKVNDHNHPCNETCEAGEAVLAYYFPSKYQTFLKYDMISFTGSLMVMFLLLSGFPLSNKFTLWLLSLVMCITITFLGLTFFEGMWLVLPGSIIADRYNDLKYPIYYVSVGVMCIVGICLLIRLSSWLQNQKCQAAWSKLCSSRAKLAAFPKAYWRLDPANTSMSRC